MFLYVFIVVAVYACSPYPNRPVIEYMRTFYGMENH